jgi:hypothetical protein
MAIDTKPVNGPLISPTGTRHLRLPTSHWKQCRERGPVPWVGAALVVLTGVTFTSYFPAHAEPIAMAPQVYDKVTRDGVHLSIRLEHEAVNPVPNLAAATNSREGFVTVSATATAIGGPAITDSLFILGYQLGCQSDVSTGLQLGGTAGIAPSASLMPPAVGITGGVAGFVQTVVQPGVIVDLPLANMSLNDSRQAMLDIDNIHIKADACGGDVTVRSYAYLRISTASEHTSFAIYGDPIKI